MEKEYFVQLTKNLYHLTLLFPKKEPLRYKMRTLADDILANLISILKVDFHKSGNPDLINELERNLEILDSFFEVAKDQNWVSKNDILEIQKDYSKIKGEVGKTKREIISEEREAKESQALNERQQKILGILREKEKVQVGEIVSLFPEVTKRTLRRDFQFLFKKGLVKRVGEKNYTFYQIS